MRQDSKAKLWVGAHLSKGKDLVDTINEIIEMGGNSLQIFLSPPINSGKGISLKESEIKTAQKLQGQIFIVIHGKYILNFCRPRSNTTEWQFECLKHDLGQANLIGADVIIHQGKNLADLGQSDAEACQTFVNNLMAILEETPELNNRIILENSCQQGNELGYTIEQLGYIFGLIDAKYRHRIGFCLDLCHIYVAGTCDLRQPTAVEQMFANFQKEIGMEYLKVIHFNDSQIVFDGHNDNHADLLIGQIGNPHLGGSSQGFQVVVKMAQTHGIPMILETPRKVSEASTEAQINLLRIWANGNQSQEEVYLKQNNIHMLQNTVVAKAKPIPKPKLSFKPPTKELLASASTTPSTTPSTIPLSESSVPNVIDSPVSPASPTPLPVSTVPQVTESTKLTESTESAKLAIKLKVPRMVLRK